MVQGQLLDRKPAQAVLAAVVISGKDVLSGATKQAAVVKGSYVYLQTNDTGQRKNPVNGADLPAVFGQNLRFFQQHQTQGPLPPDQLYRFVAGVENQRSHPRPAPPP